MLTRYDWSQLNRIQLGRDAEYFAKMEFTMFGYDVYTGEVDDKGIDFVVRKHSDTGGTRYYDIQVKSTLGLNYVFMQKSKFRLNDGLYLALVLFTLGQSPEIYLIPSTRWQETDKLFKYYPYEGLKSAPEYGLNLSKTKLALLEEFRFDTILPTL